MWYFLSNRQTIGSRNNILDSYVIHDSERFAICDLIEAHTLSEKLQKEIKLELLHPKHEIMNVDLAIGLFSKFNLLREVATEWQCEPHNQTLSTSLKKMAEFFEHNYNMYMMFHHSSSSDESLPLRIQSLKNYFNKVEG